MIPIQLYCREQSFVCTVGHLVCIWRLWRQEVPALHPGQKDPDPLPVSCTGEAPPGGEAYIREETVVIFATSWSDCCGRPWERRTLSAYIEEAHVARAVSTCMSICRFELSVTPKTRMVSTRVAPGIICEGGLVRLLPYLKTINSLVCV